MSDYLFLEINIQKNFCIIVDPSFSIDIYIFLQYTHMLKLILIELDTFIKKNVQPHNNPIRKYVNKYRNRNQFLYYIFYVYKSYTIPGLFFQFRR